MLGVLFKIWDALDKLALETKRSRNDIITIMLEYCIDNTVVAAEKKENQ